MGEKRWAAFQQTQKFVLPSTGIEVVIREPDVIGSVILGGQGLPDAFFAMFANATQEGEKDGMDFIQELGGNEEAGKGFRQFIDRLVLEAFVEPRLVENADDADYQTTVPLSDIKFVDKFAVVQQLDIMGGMSQLNGLQQFRPETNGTVAPTPKGDKLQPIAESDSSD